MLAWRQAHDVELVFTPTNASWSNWIECEFAALRYLALNGTDHRSHDEQNGLDRLNRLVKPRFSSAPRYRRDRGRSNSLARNSGEDFCRSLRAVLFSIDRRTTVPSGECWPEHAVHARRHAR